MKYYSLSASCRFLAVFFALALLAAPRASLAQEAFDTPQQFSNWVAFYYQNPQPGKVVPSFGYYVNSPLFNSSPTSRVPLSYFYAVLLLISVVCRHKRFRQSAAGPHLERITREGFCPGNSGRQSRNNCRGESRL